MASGHGGAAQPTGRQTDEPRAVAALTDARTVTAGPSTPQARTVVPAVGVSGGPPSSPRPKSITRGPWATTARTSATWYQPLEEQADIDLAVHWVIGRPGLFLNTVGDIQLLPKVLDAASRFEARPSDAALQQLMQARQMTPLFV